MKYFYKIVVLLISIVNIVYASEYLYILNDKCINDLYSKAIVFFKDSEITPLRDSRGIILRYILSTPPKEKKDLNIQTYKKIEDFLSKIENSAIIEVHIGDFSNSKKIKLKNWELTTVIANDIEAIITKPLGKIERERVNSVGYGEFLPVKNTPNNGGKSLNRVDIMILCNISGE